MEFKAGDRVHVTKYHGKTIELHATLRESPLFNLFIMVDTSMIGYEGFTISKPGDYRFGKDKEDYYTLATDEEDTEEPEVKFNEEAWRQAGKNVRNFVDSLNNKIDNDTHDAVNKPSHYMLGDIEVKDIIAIVADKYHKGSVAHNVASALEYQMRAPAKNGLEDIKKARKCLDFAIENWE